MALYDAFISYSHAKDKPIAAALQSAEAERRLLSRDHKQIHPVWQNRRPRFERGEA